MLYFLYKFFIYLKTNVFWGIERMHFKGPGNSVAESSNCLLPSKLANNREQLLY